MRVVRLSGLLLLGALLVSACGGGGGTSGGSGCSVQAPGGLLNSGTLTIGSDVSYPPQEFNPNNPQGFDIDLGKALAQKMCLNSKFVNQTFDAIIPALNAHKFDAIMSAMTINEKRKLQVDFVPYFNAGESLMAKKGSSIKINQLTDMCGHKVATESGTAEADEIKTIKCPGGSSVSNTTYPTDTEAVQQLRKGNVELAFTDSPVVAYDIKQNPDFIKVSPVLETAPEGIATRKGDPIGNAIRSAFDAIKTDGTYDNLLSRWGLKDADIRKASSS